VAQVDVEGQHKFCSALLLRIEAHVVEAHRAARETPAADRGAVDRCVAMAADACAGLPPPLRATDGKAGFRRLVNILKAHLARHASSMPARALAVTVHSVLSVADVDDDVLAAAAGALRAQPAAFRAREASMLVAALVRAGYHPSARCLEAVCVRVRAARPAVPTAT
jgi:hypothetical protein